MNYSPDQPETEPPATNRRVKARRRQVVLGLGVVVLVLAGVAAWWFLVRDDAPSGTTGETSISEPSTGDGAVQLPQNPSLAASATIDGSPADQPADLTFGEPSEFVVTVLNDGNITMHGITTELEFSDVDGPIDVETPACELPELAPDESADCTLMFTPTSDMTTVIAWILGLGPQDQEVEIAVTITLG